MEHYRQTIIGRVVEGEFIDSIEREYYLETANDMFLIETLEGEGESLIELIDEEVEVIGRIEEDVHENKVKIIIDDFYKI